MQATRDQTQVVRLTHTAGVFTVEPCHWALLDVVSTKALEGFPQLFSLHNVAALCNIFLDSSVFRIHYMLYEKHKGPGSRMIP